jgi:hypothetical protein
VRAFYKRPCAPGTPPLTEALVLKTKKQAGRLKIVDNQQAGDQTCG